MAEEKPKVPEGGLGEGDTDERFADHPELAPDESRISVENKNPRKQPVRRRADTGDLSEAEGPAPLGFKRNNDIGGDEGVLPTDADYSRGSGRLGEIPHAGARPMKNIETARHEQEEAAVGGYAAGETGISETASGPSAASPSSDLEADIEAQGPRRRRPEIDPHRRDWSAVLGKLGGSSPGSEENLALADRFGEVKFPANRDDVLKRLGPMSDFHFKGDIVVDLRHAVANSRSETFRNMNDLIDCVKDELRRAPVA